MYFDDMHTNFVFIHYCIFCSIRFPKNADRKKQWLHSLGFHEDTDTSPCFICQKHFSPSSFNECRNKNGKLIHLLVPNALPIGTSTCNISIPPFQSNCPQSISENRPPSPPLNAGNDQCYELSLPECSNFEFLIPDEINKNFEVVVPDYIYQTNAISNTLSTDDLLAVDVPSDDVRHAAFSEVSTE